MNVLNRGFLALYIRWLLLPLVRTFECLHILIYNCLIFRFHEVTVCSRSMLTCLLILLDCCYVSRVIFEYINSSVWSACVWWEYLCELLFGLNEWIDKNEPTYNYINRYCFNVELTKGLVRDSKDEFMLCLVDGEMGYGLQPSLSFF